MFTLETTVVALSVTSTLKHNKDGVAEQIYCGRFIFKQLFDISGITTQHCPFLWQQKRPAQFLWTGRLPPAPHPSPPPSPRWPAEGRPRVRGPAGCAASAGSGPGWWCGSGSGSWSGCGATAGGRTGRCCPPFLLASVSVCHCLESVMNRWKRTCF